MTAALVAAAALAAGYGLGRYRPGTRCLDWAEGALDKGRRHPAWWVAQLVFAVALAWTWTVHPRRSAANVRAWRKDRTAPTPVYDPNWAQHRTEEPK
ncbi:hypothetical protein OHT52_21240 [Streptomyces sp. NBC_00247]|uniref:hypothetical protein n=1 Tax=Streptomyces sp. NBC_00247 TaxID=2975689 RepID=UPI002E2AA0F3|nr:hypothetical protein [Streptomyces sp. NBC_00247]